MARRLCARYDSRPLLKANEPMGSWESDRRRRKWVGELSGACECEFDVH